MDEKTLEQIKKIKLLCDNNENFNKSPDDMINSDGTKNYAYVTLVMIGDKYIAGAIVLAESVRKLGSLADLVVLVTNDVSVEGKEILKKFYDHVIDVDYINVENWRTKVQKHRPYLDLVFTKFHVFNLTQYKKILLIDADAIILKHPDHIFTLKTPAGVFLPNKDEIISYNEKGEYVYDKKIEWFDKYCSCCSHGKLIPKSITDKIEQGLNKNKNNNSGISGGLILLEPNKEEFNMILRDIRTPKTLNIIKNKLIWPEQQYLGMRYSGMWTSIEPIFLGLQGFPHWSVLFGLQFAGEKPFVLQSKFSIEERVKYEDFQLWFKFYRDILNRYPELFESKVLADSNEMSKYFIAQLSRKSLQFKKILSSGLEESVSKLFNIKNTTNYYYYHINISREYDSESINYSFEDDFIPNMINDITKKTQSSYWLNINNKIHTKDSLSDNTISNKINSKILDIFKIEDRENIISYYTKINSNVCIIMIVMTEKTESNFWLDNNLISNIFYQKDIEMTGSVLKNILFNINQTYSYEEREKHLNIKYSNMTQYKIKLLFYKTVIDSNLKGNNKDIFVFSDTNTKVRASSIFLNSNTMDKFVNKQIIFIPEKQTKLYSTLTENYIYIKNMLMYQSLKKWIYNNYDGDELDNVIVDKLELSDKRPIKKFILFDTNVYTKNHEQTFSNLEKKKLEFMDIIIINKITKKNKLSPKYEDIINNIHDSRYYYQLDGIKFYL
jgi:alpha-N-acetylglucosamine transferase